jgi:ferrochelatase
MKPIGVLVMAYGGPDSLDDVEPYLLDVRGGRPASPEIVHEVRERYRAIGGRSPILERTRQQAAALERALNGTNRAGDGAAGGGTGRGEAAAPAFRSFVGMRHWHPYIADTLARMTQEGIVKAVALAMAPHYSRLSVGAYLRKLEEGRGALETAAIESWHLLPGYLEALEGRVRSALERFPARERGRIDVLLTAHSLPERILEWNDPYPAQLRQTAETLAARLGRRLAEAAGAEGRGEAEDGVCLFAYQSAAMTPDPWLGPDAGEVIDRLAAARRPGVVLAPIGFVCEHVEILYDVDIVFREQARRAGLRLERTDMLNDAPPLIASLAERVRETARGRGWL